jgi:hypothetical protein
MNVVPEENATRRDYVHVFLMSSASEQKIDALIADLHDPKAFDTAPPTADGPCRLCRRRRHAPLPGRGAGTCSSRPRCGVAPAAGNALSSARPVQRAQFSGPAG